MSQMFKYRQVIREDGVEVITIIHKGFHSFNPTSLVFPFIKECIDADEALYPVEDLINHKVITPCKMEVKNHNFTILGEVIDDKLILEHSDKLELLQHLFLNLRNHEYDKEKTIKIFTSNASEIKPMTDDGFIFLSPLKGDYEKTPVFYCGNIEKVIEEYKALTLGKKLNRTLLQSMISDENEIEPFYMYLLESFKEWDDNQKRELLAIDTGLSTKKASEQLLEFYKFYFKSPKRFMNIISKEKVKATFLKNFSIVKRMLEPTKVSSLKKLEVYIDKTYENYKTQFDWDPLKHTHPIIEQMDGRTVDGLTLKCPRNTEEVQKWGNIMSNCYGGRASSYKQGTRCLFGLLKGDELKYVFEVSYGKGKNSNRLYYGDFEGKRRAAPPKKLRDLLNKSFERNTEYKIG